jgi:hypothetical protein
VTQVHCVFHCCFGSIRISFGTWVIRSRVSAKFTAIVLFSVLVAFGDYSSAQTTEGSISASPVSGVAISVAPVVGTPQANSSLKVRVSVTNSTNRILVNSYPIQIGSVQVEIHDTAGAVLAETDLGCKRHMSTKCGPSVKLGGPVSFTTMVVMPGKTISFDYDLSKEYKLDNAKSVVVDVVARNFVLVDAPKSVTEAPIPLRNQYLSKYEQYSHTKLGPFRSKAITLQVSH